MVIENTPFRLGPILISRFLINLRQVASPDSKTAMQNFSQFSVPGFRVPASIDRVVGNMGESLEFGNHDDEHGVVGHHEDSSPEEHLDGTDNTVPDASQS